MMIKFSVTIPAYKGKYLSEAISSVLSQTYKNFELIIVDDHSPEDLKSIIEQFTDQRIKYYRNNYNCGAVNVVDNWNISLNYSTGDYVICMGDDDMLTPSCLEDYCKIIEKYPDLNIYHTRTVIIDDDSQIYDLQEQRPEYESGYSLWWHRWNGRNKQYIGDFLFERSNLIEQGGFFFLPLAWGSDDISAVRAALPKGIANVNSIGFCYRRSKYTISMSDNEKLKVDAILLEKEWYIKRLVDASSNSEIDNIIILILKRDINVLFQKKIYFSILRDVYVSPFRVFYWMKNYHKTNVGWKKLIFAFLKSFLKMMAKPFGVKKFTVD